MEELSFKIVKMLGAPDEVIARSSNFIIARAAYDTAVALWNGDAIELRQGARVLNKSKPESA
jgi:hypothetical protein